MFETRLQLSNYNCEDDARPVHRGDEGGTTASSGVVIAHVEANVHLHAHAHQDPRAAARRRSRSTRTQRPDDRERPRPRRPRARDDGEPGLRRPGVHPDDDRQDPQIRKWGDDRGFDFDIEVDGGVKADWTIAACARPAPTTSSPARQVRRPRRLLRAAHDRRAAQKARSSRRADHQGLVESLPTVTQNSVTYSPLDPAASAHRRRAPRRRRRSGSGRERAGAPAPRWAA